MNWRFCVDTLERRTFKFCNGGSMNLGGGYGDGYGDGLGNDLTSNHYNSSRLEQDISGDGQGVGAFYADFHGNGASPKEWL